MNTVIRTFYLHEKIPDLMTGLYHTVVNWYWDDNLVEEPIGPFKSEDEAIKDYLEQTSLKDGKETR